MHSRPRAGEENAYGVIGFSPGLNNVQAKRSSLASPIPEWTGRTAHSEFAWAFPQAEICYCSTLMWVV